MPIAGLHDVIVNLLESLSATHKVSTWNIFHEQNSDITFRLKFSSHSVSSEYQGEGHLNTEGICRTTSYRQKTEKQISRDRERSERYFKNRSMCNHLEKQCMNQETQVSVSQLDMESFRNEQLSENEPNMVINDSEVNFDRNSTFDFSKSQDSFEIPNVSHLTTDHVEQSANGYTPDTEDNLSSTKNSQITCISKFRK